MSMRRDVCVLTHFVMLLANPKPNFIKIRQEMHNSFPMTEDGQKMDRKVKYKVALGVGYKKTVYFENMST